MEYVNYMDLMPDGYTGICEWEDVNYEKNGKTVVVKMRKHLSFSERVEMEHTIVSMVTRQIKDTGRYVYIPAAEEVAMNYAIIRYFTNISLPFDDIDSLSNVFEYSDIASFVRKYVGDAYIHQIASEVGRLITYNKDCQSSSHVLYEVSASVQRIIESIKGIFDNLDPDDLAAIIDKFGDTIAKESAEEK